MTHDVRPGQRRRHHSNNEEIIIILAPDHTPRAVGRDWFYWCTSAQFDQPTPLTERSSNSARTLAVEYPTILSEDWQDLPLVPEPAPRPFHAGQAVRVLNISPRTLDESEGGIIGQRGEVLGVVAGARTDYRVVVTHRNGTIHTWEFGGDQLEPWAEPRPFRVGDRVRGPERARYADRSFRPPSRWDGRRTGTVSAVCDDPGLYGDVVLTLDANDYYPAEELMLYFADELELLPVTGRFSERNPAEQILPSGPASVANPLQVLATELLEEAKNRGWCSEYDDFAQRVNGLLPEPVLMDREGNLAAPRLPEQSFVVRVTYRPSPEHANVSAVEVRDVLRATLQTSGPLNLERESVRITAIADPDRDVVAQDATF